MEVLNVYCLSHIFDYLTPVDLVQVSQVCRQWKMETLKQWKKIDKILVDIYKKNQLEAKNLDRNEAPVISGTVANKIAICAAPYIKVVQVTFSGKKQDKFVKFGLVWYKVENFNADQTFKLLVENATGITEVVFDTLPSTELLQLLFMSNKIKKLKVCKAKPSFNQNIRTNEIEDLDVSFFIIDTTNVAPFEGHFPNLKKLRIAVSSFHVTEDLVPYNHPAHWDIHFLQYILNFSDLEDLLISVGPTDMSEPWSDFIFKMKTSCPKLRSLQLLGIKVTEDSVETFQSLPRLEILDLELRAGFRLVHLSRLTNLTEVGLDFENDLSIDVCALYSTILNMPKLTRLEIHEIRLKDAFKFAMKVAVLALEQNKDILITHPYQSKAKKMKIEKIVDRGSVESRKILKLLFAIRDYEEEILFGKLIAFIKEQFNQYHAFIVEDD